MDDKNKKQKDWANKLFGRQQKSAKKDQSPDTEARNALMKKQLGANGKRSNFFDSKPQTSDSADENQSETTNPDQSSEETQEGDQKNEQLREKSGITQGINSLRNRKQLAEISTQKDDYTNKKKVVGKEINKQKKTISPLERKRKNLEREILVLKIFKILLYLMGALLALTIIFFFLIPIAQMFFGAARAITGIQLILKKRLDEVKKEMEPVKEKIEENEKKIVDYSKAIKDLSEKQYQLQNQSLFSRNSPNA